MNQHQELTLPEVIAGFAFFSFLGLIARMMNWLTAGGAFVATVIGNHLFSISGLSLLPLLVFFISGVLLNKLKGHISADKKSGKPRDEWQVFANGGVVYMISAIQSLTGTDLFSLYLVSIAVATADTWSSEIGSRLGSKTIDILTLRKIPSGLSGGISTIGTLASVAGAVAISLFSESLFSAVIITFLGVAGSMVDSALGSGFQYEEGRAKWRQSQGLPQVNYWMSNDSVNFFSNLITAVFGFALLKLTGI